MTAEQAIRFCEHEARRCRDRDTAEAICLLLPAIRDALKLYPMDDFEALEFRTELKQSLLRREHATAAA